MAKDRSVMRAADAEQLAAKLRRPPASMAGLRDLTPEQVGVLSDAIDAAVATHGRTVHEAFQTALPLLPRRLLIRVLGFADSPWRAQ